jgi:ElaB/YqjD/DUF883 family membrane-anchored ribosome-binding protein
MAAERDHPGEARPGLTGAGRDGDAMGDRVEGGAVRGGMHTGPEARGERMEGLGFADPELSEETGRSVRGIADEAREQAEHLAERARHAAGELGHQAGDAAAAARDRLAGLRDRANRALERQGILERLRENPLPVLGVAFAIGFLIAGRDDAEPGSRAARARGELRGALLAGLSAGLAQGARSFLTEAGSEGGGFLSSLLDGILGEEEAPGRTGRTSTGRAEAGPSGYRGPRTAARTPHPEGY